MLMDYTIGGLKRHHGGLYLRILEREEKEETSSMAHHHACYMLSSIIVDDAPSQQQPQWHRTTSLPFVSLDFDVFLLCGAGVCYHYRLPT